MRGRREIHAVPGRGAEISLTERLERGPLPLTFALQCATDVATALRQMHGEGYAHGAVHAGMILLRDSSARLLPPVEISRAPQREDVAGFGAVLYQLIHGYAPPADFAAARMPRATARPDVEGIIAAANSLAHRCMVSSAENTPRMQRVLVEVRLLSVLARMPRRVAHKESVTNPGDAAPPSLPARPVPAGPPVITVEVQADPVSELLSGDQRCPKCGSNYLHESRERTWFERWLTRFGIPIFRCRRCYYRFFVVVNSVFSKESPLE